jgi:hypothetical protein
VLETTKTMMMKTNDDVKTRVSVNTTMKTRSSTKTNNKEKKRYNIRLLVRFLDNVRCYEDIICIQ